ncbi:hypothetical protein M426DRAFT_11906 [Hypoxylon sp. CI-4A]|nr:hypothetical protein M426DRAFT_11906 [Hypoxylon sp. CI-4A]
MSALDTDNPPSMHHKGWDMEFDDSDVDISNGTCYYTINGESDDDYIPCGNVATGSNWHCCVAGDICLASKACFHRRFQITYLAGCTDPSYSSANCPHKGELGDKQWVGLDRCEPDTDQWAACTEDDDVPGSKPPGPCSCDPGYSNAVLSDSPVLSNIASLPSSAGGEISWFEGKRPDMGHRTITQTLTPTMSFTSTSTLPESLPTTGLPLTVPSMTSSSSPTSTTPASTTSAPTTPAPSTSSPINASPIVPAANEPNQSTSHPTGTNLSVAAQAGVGVGAGVGALLIGCLIYLAILLRRRRNMKRENPDFSGLVGPPPPPSELGNGTGNGHSYPGPPNPSSPSSYAGFKSELAADEPTTRSSVPTSPNMTQQQQQNNRTSSLPSSPGSPGSQRQFQAYNPSVHGNYAHRSQSWSQNNLGEALVSPLSTSTLGGSAQPQQQQQRSPGLPKEQGSGVSVVHELE